VEQFHRPYDPAYVVVQVYAFYHKDIDATQKTARLMINEAIKTPKGLAYTVVGSSTLTIGPIANIIITSIILSIILILSVSINKDIILP
jgi:hypothetical protein